LGSVLYFACQTKILNSKGTFFVVVVVVVVVFEGKGLATVLRKEKGIPPRFISRNNTQFLRV